MSASEKPKLLNKLQNIYKTIPFVGKNAKNDALGYDYMRAVDVAHAVRNAFLDSGIWAEVQFEVLGAPYTIARSENKAPFAAINVKCTMRLEDVESGEVRTVSALGAGADMGDKAIFKAQTGALKYALRAAFLIPDEADPEADSSTDEKPEGWTPGWSPIQAPPVSTHVVPAADATQGAPNTVSQGSEAGEALPSEEELKGFLTRLRAATDSASAAGGLGPSPNLPVNTKMRVYVLARAGHSALKNLTLGEWNDILSMIESANNLPKGWAKLATAVDAANGIQYK